MTLEKTMLLNHKPRSQTKVQNTSPYLFKCKIIPTFSIPQTEPSNIVGPPPHLQASDLLQQLELASELEFDLQHAVDWGKKWRVYFNAEEI